MMSTRLTAALLAALMLLTACGQPAAQEEAFSKKADLLWEQVQTAWDGEPASPAGEAGNAVFFSVCDGTARAHVRSGTGETLEAAWSAAVQETEALLKNVETEPLWVKADVVCASEPITPNRLAQRLSQSREEFFYRGLAFDKAFDTSLLEAELHGSRIYKYEDGSIDLKYLNNYLRRDNRETLEKLPEEYTLFQCRSWFCDTDDTIYELIPDGPDGGRRKTENLDKAYAEGLILNASAFLNEQVREDGSFIYGYYPRFDSEMDTYNIVRHAGTIWAMLLSYRVSPDEAMAENIRKAADYLVSQVRYDNEGRGYVLEEKSDEVKLGGCGVAVLALTEYTDVFQEDTYRDVCLALGEGILSMLNLSTGEYYHVLNGDLSRKEAYRTVYYDGEATFALCRLYGLTGDSRWLDAARAAADHFIAADYTQYRDHWVSYSMNEITKYVTDNPAYWSFAMDNAMDNWDRIQALDVTSPICLELLMAAFEAYDRAADPSLLSPKELDALVDLIRQRADRMLSGYFYPEYAIYMKEPQKILNSFMVRNDSFRVRIDDVQHNIGGYYLYWKNYDRLVECGLLTAGKG